MKELIKTKTYQVILFLSFLFLLAIPSFAESLTTLSALDLSFGVDGVATALYGTAAETSLAALEDSEGRLILVGRTAEHYFSTGIDFFMARFLADGTLDPSFASAGRATLSVTNSTDRPSSVVLQSDGKIVLAGKCGAFLCAARFDPSPAVNDWDDTFNPDSSHPYITFSPGSGRIFDDHVALAVDLNDDSLVLGGTITQGAFVIDYERDFVFIRLNANGADLGFGGTPGLKIVPVNNRNDILGDLILKSNVILAGGQTRYGVLPMFLGDPNASGDDDIVLVALDATTGNLVSSYGNNGVVRLTKSGTHEMLKALYFTGGNELYFTGSGEDDLILGKFHLVLNTNAELDLNFGGQGYITTQAFEQRTVGQDLKMDSQGHIIVKAGRGVLLSQQKLVLSRFSTVDGTLDQSFGNSGFVIHEDYNVVGKTLVVGNSRIIVGTQGGAAFDLVALGFLNPQIASDVVDNIDDTADDGSDSFELDLPVVIDEVEVEDMPGGAAEGDGGCSCDFRQASAPLPFTPFLIFLGVAMISLLQIRRGATKRSKS